MGVIEMLMFQAELARLIDNYVAPAANDYFAY